MVNAAARAGNAALWVTAVLGVASLLLGVATVVAGVQPLIFRSSSMAPAVDAGALALAKTVDADRVKVGDIVSVVNSSGVRVTHRVVETEPVEEGRFSLTLQGDSNKSPDESPYVVTEVDRVFFDVPYLGYLANWLASPWAMFAAGILVALLAASLWRRRSESSGLPGAGSGAAAVVAVGLAAAALVPVPRTEAYFSDKATFEAGVIQSHQVRIFDLADPGECVQSGNNIVINWIVASPRYRTLWYRTAVNGPVTGSSIKTDVPTGAANSAVATTFTKAEVSNTNASYELVGISQLKGSATAPWRSVQERRVGVLVDGTGLRCGITNRPPSIAFTAPQDGASYLSKELAEADTLLRCFRRTPCGTAADLNGISVVEYRLQRTGITTQCWNPDGGGYVLYGCGTWRRAETSPQVPTSGAGTVTWRVPTATLTNSAFNYAGRYTLYLRVTDNSSPTTATTERTIQFTVL